jgi:hypothetical protein
MPIRQYLEDQSAFDRDAIKAMSDALERACCGFLRLRTGIPIDCGQSFQSIADSIPMIADSSPTDGF